jgi:hypothetical protein
MMDEWMWSNGEMDVEQWRNGRGAMAKWMWSNGEIVISGVLK